MAPLRKKGKKSSYIKDEDDNNDDHISTPQLRPSIIKPKPGLRNNKEHIDMSRHNIVMLLKEKIQCTCPAAESAEQCKTCTSM